MLNSVWMSDTKLPEFPPLVGNVKTDVAIIGGGMAGILCAHRLTQQGIECAVVEADRVFSGISRNTTAKVTSQHGLCYHKLIRRLGIPAARSYWQANQMALRQISRLAEGIPCDFQKTDSYIFTRGGQGLLEQEVAALYTLGIRAEYINRTGLPIPVTGAIRFPGQAQFHPVKFAAGLLPGLQIYEHSPIRRWKGRELVTDRGSITARKIIVATHFPIFNKHGGYFLKMYQQRSYVLALENAPALDGMYLEAGENGISVRTAGDFLLLGGGGHRTGQQGGGWEELEKTAGVWFPETRERCRWVAQDCMTLDGMPYIGPYGRHTPDVFVAAGFNKWGMTSSMAAAMVLTDLVQERQNPWAQVFSPQRSSAYPQLLANIAHSTLNLLRPTVPRCPHLGCALRWNEAEHSWDCPCHGSRFHEDGTLLDGPANGNLK